MPEFSRKAKLGYAKKKSFNLFMRKSASGETKKTLNLNINTFLKVLRVENNKKKL